MSKTMMVLACWGLIAGAVLAAEPQRDNPERTGPLAAMPSAPGAHLEKIKALGENEWIELGKPAPDPKWGQACGRTWGAQALVLAPELRGAFLFGEGPHAHIKPDGHAMDDLWFYDINTHRWLCLYPGMNPKTFTQRVKDGELRIDELGRMVDRDGQPIPMHTHIHAWGYLAYDTDRKKLRLGGAPNFSTYFLGGADLMKPGMDLLAEQRKGKRDPKAWSGFLYNTITGRFELEPATGSAAADAFSLWVYVPASKRFFMAGSGGVGTYDPEARTYAEIGAKGPKPPGYDISGCYDSKRNRIYMATAGTHAYDIASRTWTELKPAGTGPVGRTMDWAWGTNRISMQYDVLNDAVVAVMYSNFPDDKARTAGVYAYSPEVNSWDGPRALPAGVAKLGNAANTCYDRELNAWFCYVAGDGDPRSSMWVYRYKKAAK